MDLADRLIEELQNYKQQLMSKGIEEVYNRSYYTALMFELEYTFFKPFDDSEDEEFYARFGALKDYKGNIYEGIIDFYDSLRHRERYNFFNEECLGWIIDEFINENVGGKK